MSSYAAPPRNAAGPAGACECVSSVVLLTEGGWRGRGIKNKYWFPLFDLQTILNIQTDILIDK